MVDWNELVHREGPAVWRTAYRLVDNRADADECLQEAFIAAVRLANRQTVGNWPALLKRLAIARAVDCVRRRLCRARCEDATDVGTIATAAPNPHEEAEATELANAIRWALGQLPARSAEAFCLHELEGWSYQEIGGHLSMSSGAVGALLHRTRQKLQKLLPNAWEHKA
jgi:RNA polymerase sigma-70 factor (ECF subfamily)